MLTRTVVFFLCYALFIVMFGKAFPIQSTQKGNNSRLESAQNLFSNDLSEQKVSSKTTTLLPLFDCLGLDICQIGIHFCNERKKVCEKCEDYQHACGTNYQPVNCTQYCMNILVKRKCNEVVTSVSTMLPTIMETTETSKLGAFAEKPESGFDQKWIVIAILVIIVVPSLVGNVFALYSCFNGCDRQSTQKEYNEPEQKLLPKDCPVFMPVDTSDSFDFTSKEYTSDPSEDDNSGYGFVLLSASFIPPDNSDQDQTSVKLNHKCLPSRDNNAENMRLILRKLKMMSKVERWMLLTMCPLTTTQLHRPQILTACV
ncbi:hypothetical protein CHS0354_022532 [Potamilus streckersoni]|uniref:Uncharacterized protein n=1 Tax=Potamilus streckersoni TaxID=2493646 RepID=A0AAE0SFJ3_9BIVA|nr:hypothetical protein CHS0354_022532 [Potamilus streckersoni]